MKQPIKMTPGDELHLTALMAPFSLNLVTGQDRQHLLGYGRAAFEAGKAGQCLHQIQEPAAAEQAAWHAGLDEGRAQAAPSVMAVPDGWKLVPVKPTKEMLLAAGFSASAHGQGTTGLEKWEAFLNNAPTPPSQARAALADTPAAAPVDKSPELQGSVVDKTVNLQDAAAAPVVLPEPVGPIVEKLLALARILNTAVEDWGESSEDNSMDVKFHSDVVTEMDAILDYFDSLPDGPDENVIESGPAKAARILRAMLAGVSAPAALAGERGEVLVTVSGFTGSGKSAIAGEIEIMCRALGLQVEWPDSDSEKHMTHADWIAALEQYKPRVRIVECNVPHSVVKGQDK